ncbi:neuropeptides capa receptor-like [Cylas formicarius]|uniref:neuropeptides capa receptor-like n=1 Tax=Cylas formicarius TaxID=197179 RepID=UPI002958760F|nr:neuropeptides capa receptor-like [Cylas formicarius]
MDIIVEELEFLNDFQMDSIYKAENIECGERVVNESEENVFDNPWTYISCFYGPQTQELPIAIFITVINVIIFITGLLGNIAVCIVIFKQPTLHSATNYYLFNLAVSDVTLLIFGLPNDVMMYWHQYPWYLGEAFCKFRALISETASYVSVLTIVAFSTERYIAICYPLHRRAVSGLQRAIWIITGLWIVSFFSAIPFAISTVVHFLDYPIHSKQFIEESAMCAMTSQPANIPLTEMSTIIFFVIPLLIIMVQYTNMGITIWRTAETNFGNKLKGSVHRKNRRLQSNKSIIRMLSFVVLGFFVCWAPFHAQRVLSVYMGDDDDSNEIKYWVFLITGVFYYFSSTLNPILYNVMSDRMRNAFKEVFFGIKQKKPSTYSTFRETSHTTISVQHPAPICNLCNDDDLYLNKDSALLFADNSSKRGSYQKCSKKHADFLNAKQDETCV